MRPTRFPLLLLLLAGALLLSVPAPSPGQDRPAAPPTPPAHTNRLIQESSPYLLQHAHNPVDWYPWGEEAFAKAKAEDKPIFLSIGYSTCHWCHVMERESFENEEIAALLNRDFVAIKVDREERPDVDAVYMDAVMALTGDGGWPLTVFLTPDRKPFFGGTYFPPDERSGRPGLKQVLALVQDTWTKKRADPQRSAADLTQALRENARPAAAVELDAQVFVKAVNQFWLLFDRDQGGFGRQAKFPRSHALSALLRAGRRTADPRADEMVRLTLDRMARGGMYDQVGGGFHRYSTDPAWRVPHFEKTLYDQALLAWAYLEAFQVEGRADWARVSRATLDYCLRDLLDPDGGFHSAEDADSEGVEGKFYLWTPTEIAQVLGPDGDTVAAYFDVTAEGNYEQRKSILRVPVELEPFAAAHQLEPAAFGPRLEAARTKLYVARARRVRPHQDDKVLAAWNGLAIGALAQASAVLEDARYLHAALRAAEFVLGKMQRDGRLLRRWRAGKAEIPAYAEDYACLAWGLFELYEATFDPRWLREAHRLAAELVRLFGDDTGGGGLWFTGRDTAELIVRTRDIYDGALPSSNSMAAIALLRIGRLTADPKLEEAGRAILKAFSATIAGQPEGYPVALLALDFALGPTREIVLAGDPDDPTVESMVKAVRRRFRPNQVVALVPSAPAATRAAVEAAIPFVKGLELSAGKPAAYLCENFACRAPITDPAEFEKALDARPAGR